MSEPPVHPEDRLGMTLFLAVVLHALVILGVGLRWEPELEGPQEPMMEVTVARDQAETPPEEADFLAELDQDGGGTADEAQVPSPLAGTPLPPAPEMDPADEPRQQAAESADPAVAGTDPGAVGDAPAPAEERAPPAPEAAEQRPEAGAHEAAALAQRLSQPREPSKRFLDARTRAHEAAAYLADWTRKVEAVGNLNYPSAARERELSGRLILQVTLEADGSLADVEIVDRSPHRLLDEAALRIVRLGAPYARVPDEVLDGRDQLVITRTWAFVDGEGVEVR